MNMNDFRTLLEEGKISVYCIRFMTYRIASRSQMVSIVDPG